MAGVKSCVSHPVGAAGALQTTVFFDKEFAYGVELRQRHATNWFTRLQVQQAGNKRCPTVTQ